MTLQYLNKLAAAAKPQPVFPDGNRERDGGDDWGSERQIAAENDFFDALDLFLTGKLVPEEERAFAAFCAKATSDERIDEGLRLAAIALSR
jgi:hypothetical protein